MTTPLEMADDHLRHCHGEIRELEADKARLRLQLDEAERRIHTLETRNNEMRTLNDDIYARLLEATR